jgi:polysaccharide biosynthesis transport protein
MPSEMLTLNDYIAVVRRRKWVILACFLTFAVLGAGYAMSKGTTHRATVDVSATYLQPPTSSGGSAGSPGAAEDARFLANQAAFARSSTVLAEAVKLAAKAKVVTTATKLASASSVTPSSVADILSFAVTNHNPATAKTLASAYASAYVTERKAQIHSQYDPLVKTLRAQIASWSKQLQSPTLPDGQARSIRPRLALATKMYAPLVSFVSQDLLGTKVQPTTSDVETVKSSAMTFAIAGGLAGLVIGLIVAFVWDAVDRGARTGREVAGSLQLPVLANIPTPPRKLSTENRLASLEVDEPSAEAYRLLAVRLELVAGSTGRNTVLFTSALDSEGKSTTAANVAVALAGIGKSVVLIDADLLRPTAARYFGGELDPGLFEVLSGDLDFEEVGRDVHLPGAGNGGQLRVISPGRVLGDPTGLLASKGLSDMLSALGQWADYVIVDSPPLLTVSHAMVLSSKVDAVVVVARADRMTPDVSWNLQQTLNALPAPTLGVVMTAADAAPGYGYGYGYGYGTAPSDTGAQLPFRRNGFGRTRDGVGA